MPRSLGGGKSRSALPGLAGPGSDAQSKEAGGLHSFYAGRVRPPGRWGWICGGGRVPAGRGMASSSLGASAPSPRPTRPEWYGPAAGADEEYCRPSVSWHGLLLRQKAPSLRVVAWYDLLPPGAPRRKVVVSQCFPSPLRMVVAAESSSGSGCCRRRRAVNLK